MKALTITGGRGLFGSVRIPGAKNSVLPLMAASMLCHGSVSIEGAPHLSDVDASMRILHSVGCRAFWSQGRIIIQPCDAPGSAISETLMHAMRSSLFYLAPLLARTGRADVHRPGGCRLGARPIDMHLAGLAQMGVRVEEKESGALTLTAPHGLRGADITLRYPSVGTTETLLMAAVSARGHSILRGAATEPEVVDLTRFLQAAGARISGAGTREIHIDGGGCLMGARHTVCPDRITAATVLAAAAGCGGEVLLTNVNGAQLDAVLQVLRKMGCMVSASGEHSVALASDGHLRAVPELRTGVYPAFPTDAAPLLAASLLRAGGESTLIDTVFEHRFACAEGFVRLGASVAAEGRMLRVHGTGHLRGAAACAPDLRGGAALVLAALQAEGKSRIVGVEHIDRGYEDMAALFASLGAEILREDVDL